MCDNYVFTQFPSWEPQQEQNQVSLKQRNKWIDGLAM